MDTNEKKRNMLISSDELFDEISDRQDHPEFSMVLISILLPKYFKDCRIKNSINIPFDKIADYVEDWYRQRPIVIYGAMGDSASCEIAYRRLIDMGFSDVRILVGGIQEWFEKGYPCEGRCKKDYLSE